MMFFFLASASHIHIVANIHPLSIYMNAITLLSPLLGIGL